MSNLSDEKMAQLYQSRKNNHRLTKAQKKALLSSKLRQNKSPWYQRMQFMVACCGLLLLLNVMLFNHQSTPESLNQVMLENYQTIAIVDFEQNQITTTITHTNALQAYQDAKQRHDDFFELKAHNVEAPIMTAKLISKQDDWYIESCDKTLLVQLKKELLNELQITTHFDLDTQPGQWFVLEQNSQGQFIRFEKTTIPSSC